MFYIYDKCMRRWIVSKKLIPIGDEYPRMCDVYILTTLNAWALEETVIYDNYCWRHVCSNVICSQTNKKGNIIQCALLHYVLYDILWTLQWFVEFIDCIHYIRVDYSWFTISQMKAEENNWLLLYNIQYISYYFPCIRVDN